MEIQIAILGMSAASHPVQGPYLIFHVDQKVFSTGKKVHVYNSRPTETTTVGGKILVKIKEISKIQEYDEGIIEIY